jgi:hypothetical protein
MPERAIAKTIDFIGGLNRHRSSAMRRGGTNSPNSPQRRYNPCGSTGATHMTNAQEKRVNRIAELKGFRLEKGGHGKGHGRFYIMDVAEGGRVRSGVPDREYSFSLEEAEAWLAGHSK